MGLLNSMFRVLSTYNTFNMIGLPILTTLQIGRGSFKDVASISIKSMQKQLCTMFRSCVVIIYSVGLRSILWKR